VAKRPLLGILHGALQKADQVTDRRASVNRVVDPALKANGV